MIARKCLPFESWPAVDRLAWEAARQPGDPLSDAGGAVHWSEKNCRQIVTSYGRWLRYLTLTGQLGPGVPPGERISEPSLMGFVAGLRQDDLSSETVFSTVRNLKSALSVMAPDADLLILKRLVARLDRERTPRPISLRNSRRRLATAEPAHH